MAPPVANVSASDWPPLKRSNEMSALMAAKAKSRIDTSRLNSGESRISLTDLVQFLLLLISVRSGDILPA